jgi:hypothetical protein
MPVDIRDIEIRVAARAGSASLGARVADALRRELSTSARDIAVHVDRIVVELPEATGLAADAPAKVARSVAESLWRAAQESP